MPHTLFLFHYFLLVLFPFHHSPAIDQWPCQNFMELQAVLLSIFSADLLHCIFLQQGLPNWLQWNHQVIFLFLYSRGSQTWFRGTRFLKRSFSSPSPEIHACLSLYPSFYSHYALSGLCQASDYYILWGLCFCMLFSCMHIKQEEMEYIVFPRTVRKSLWFPSPEATKIEEPLFYRIEMTHLIWK